MIFSFLDPLILPQQQVDKGAIKFLLSGANVMCRGLTSPGAKLVNLPKGAIVVSLLAVIVCVLRWHMGCNIFLFGFLSTTFLADALSNIFGTVYLKISLLKFLVLL